ncbi:hypothetical protein ANN_02732 [Periplaneta americana]|uniref:Uncharacterized protein n=1 Tax=Periplaneta americana TaxID=6978 RepID=A0ABQ8TX24_PERAM|nr:hypothetical protein ANN_02732 [Periplaneta americana]
MDLREVGYDDRDWINLAQDRDRFIVYYTPAGRDIRDEDGPEYPEESLPTISQSMDHIQELRCYAEEGLQQNSRFQRHSLYYPAVQYAVQRLQRLKGLLRVRDRTAVICPSHKH